MDEKLDEAKESTTPPIDTQPEVEPLPKADELPATEQPFAPVESTTTEQPIYIGKLFEREKPMESTEVKLDDTEQQLESEKLPECETLAEAEKPVESEKPSESSMVSVEATVGSEKNDLESERADLEPEMSVIEIEKSVEEDNEAVKTTATETSALAEVESEKVGIESETITVEAEKVTKETEKPVESVQSPTEERPAEIRHPSVIEQLQVTGPSPPPPIGQQYPSGQMSQQQQQPRPGMARTPGPPGQRMAGPRMGGPRMGGPRGPGPRMGGPRPQQRAPEPSGFGGFMSMFGAPAASNKQAASSGFFSSPQTSFFGSSPVPPPASGQAQQKSSFFALPTNLPTESLTSDLFGMFNKEQEPPKPLETLPQEPTGPSENETVSGTGVVKDSCDPEKSALSGEADVTTEGGPTEDTQRPSEEEKEALSEGEVTHEEPGVVSREPDSSGVDKAGPPPAAEPKGMFDIPSLAPSTFGFMSGASDGASSLGSFFSSTPSTPPATAKTPQDGGLFSGFKGLSSGIFQEEKPARKEEPPSAASMFGKTLGFPWQSGPEPPKAESPPSVVTTQPRAQDARPADADDGFSDAEADSDATEGADPSDTDEPTDTSGKTGSMDKSPGSSETLTMQSGIPSEAVSLAMSLSEGSDKPKLHITPPEVGKDTLSEPPSSTEPNAANVQPKDTLLMKDPTKSPVDSSRFGSSGNLSQASSQLSSEPEAPHPTSPHPPLHSQQKASWEEEEEEEKGLRAVPEPGSNKDLKESIITPPKPLDNRGTEKQISFCEHGPPPCSPVRVRWLKVINKVRVQLLEGRDGDPSQHPWAKPGGATPFGIDSMPDLRKRRPIPLVSELVSFSDLLTFDS
ncbi:cell surface glycoprotein 1-like [Oncorhynchus clarkii lewisi]|uniref:cell surface glycoprotein 1-like n=1 Tax=Oncorhynchus clarkii lewisi TaxID=490388 RepID=UPI0039B8C74E